MGSLSMAETIDTDPAAKHVAAIYKSKVVRRKKKLLSQSKVHLPVIQFDIIPSLHCIPLGESEHQQTSDEHYDYCDDTEYDEFIDDYQPTSIKQRAGGRSVRVTNSNKKLKVKKDKLTRVHNETRQLKRIERVKENQLNQKSNVETVLLKNGIRRFGHDIYNKQTNTATIVSRTKHVANRTYTTTNPYIARDPPSVIAYELKKKNIPKKHGFLSQLVDLQHRELTPEDYELLLLLENTVTAKTVDPKLIQSINEISAVDLEQVLGELCSICMECFEIEGAVKMLPNCGHCFHSKCIDSWLANSSLKCPLDGLEVFPQ